MTEIKITTPLLVYRFEREETKEYLTESINNILGSKLGYIDESDKETVLIPYNVLKNSTIEIYNVNS